MKKYLTINDIFSKYKSCESILSVCEKFKYMQKYHLLFVPEAASAAVGKSIEGGTLACVIVGTAHALVVIVLVVAVLDDDNAGINTGDVVEVMSDDLFILSVTSESCFFSDCCVDFSASIGCCC